VPPHHAIRLRGAWSVAADGPRFRHTRPFGWPTALDPHERVWLVVAGAAPADALLVNDVPVAPEADVTTLLRPRNAIVLVRDTADPPGEVTLEVRPLDSAPG
jgi:hypothetical protein